ncbi:MAG TPA: helix-turn-helix domain-containing protein [Solirubrobacteraceae bacterium]|nr:helix-turn-helix domain-containing protein [Solirubrobacteraceae bacterium]
MLDSPTALDPHDVLAQPTRAQLFELLGELRRPAGTVELARLLRLHPNGVRMHLGRLQQAGLIARSRARAARGRPRDLWTVAPGARPAGEAPHAYHDLGRWLARAIGSGRSGQRGVEAAGRQIGRELAPGRAVGEAEALQAAFAALGYQPTVTRGRDGRLTYHLGNCPYRDVARECQPVICALHRGITRGLLDVLTTRARLAAFVPHDPDIAGCVIELRNVAVADAAPRRTADA